MSVVKELLTPENVEYQERARHIAEKVMRPSSTLNEALAGL